MKDHYEFDRVRPNPYAEKMKNGYSVAIHYETLDDAESDGAMSRIKDLLRQPGLNSLHLYIKERREGIAT